MVFSSSITALGGLWILWTTSSVRFWGGDCVFVVRCPLSIHLVLSLFWVYIVWFVVHAPVLWFLLLYFKMRDIRWSKSSMIWFLINFTLRLAPSLKMWNRDLLVSTETEMKLEQQNYFCKLNLTTWGLRLVWCVLLSLLALWDEYKK